VDKQVVILFINTMKLENEIQVDNRELDKLYNDFEIYRGEWVSGNNNVKVIKELRTLTLQLMKLKRIPNSVGKNLLAELNL
jgi:hypothetical protein